MELVKGQLKMIVIAILIAIGGVACSVVPYYAVAQIVNQIASGIRVWATYQGFLWLILAGLVGSVTLHQIATLMSHHIAYRVIEGQRIKLTHKLSRLSMGEIEIRSSGEWAYFMGETLDKLEQPIAHMIPEVIANLTIPIVLEGIILLIDWRIGLINLLTLPLGILCACLMMKDYEDKSRQYQAAAREMNATAVAYIRGIKVIKAFNKTASSYDKFVDAVNQNRDSMLNWYLSICFYMTAAMEILPASLIFVLPAALYFYLNGTLLLTDLSMCVLLAYAAYRPLIKAMTHMDNMASLQVVLTEIQSIMSLPELKRPELEQEIGSYEVAFKEVGFAYQEGKAVLEQVSFTAEAQQLTAIVGYSGSGKSTIAKLIAGYWPVKEGQICIGQVPLESLSLDQHMGLITYVTQENYLFRQTIAANLRLAKPDASQAEIEQACRNANCHDFIMELPQGYDTLMSEAGHNLSGGERQRLTIARALLKDSPIVLLDEATAYMDPDNEAAIQASINALIQEKTVIMIAHRLSTIQHADKIIVVNQGQIEAQGQHHELLNQSKTYASMWRAHTQVNQKEGIL